MIKPYIRSTIIGLIQAILPIIALLALAPWFINTDLLTRWQTLFGDIQPWFLGFHGVIYVTLILLWPKLVRRLQIPNQLSSEQLSRVLKIRWYLLSIFILIDVLMIGRIW